MKIIKYLVLIFSFVLSFSINDASCYTNTSTQNYWLRFTSVSTKTLYRCIFTDTLNGWAAGDSGVIIHTSNGGANWVSQNSNINYFINDVFFLNPRLGWCIANDFYFEGTTILKTTNGGDNWIFSRYPDTTLIINDVYYLDSLTGFMCGFNGLVLKTTNAGANWNICAIENNVYAQFPMFKITFYDNMNGVSCGGIMDIAGLIWRTTDGGSYWYTSDTLPVPILNIKYRGSQKIYASGGEFDFGIFFCKSSNAGSIWTNMNLGYIGIAQSVAFRTGNECWVPMGYTQNWMLSIDSTKSWNLIPVPDSSGIFDAVFLDENRGWAFGQYGSIYKYNPLIGITNNSSAVQFKLSQNYPNPFNPSTIINYQLPSSKIVKLTVYDILGKVVKILVNEKQNSGSYEVQFDGSNLSSGVYFYKLEALSTDGSSTGEFVESKKMILLK